MEIRTSDQRRLTARDFLLMHVAGLNAGNHLAVAEYLSNLLETVWTDGGEAALQLAIDYCESRAGSRRVSVGVEIGPWTEEMRAFADAWKRSCEAYAENKAASEVDALNVE